MHSSVQVHGEEIGEDAQGILLHVLERGKGSACGGVALVYRQSGVQTRKSSHIKPDKEYVTRFLVHVQVFYVRSPQTR